jgi:hypothetical protein
MPAHAGNPGRSRLLAVEAVPACHAGGRRFESRRSVEIPANRHIVLSVLTPVWRRLHTLFSKRRRKGQKRPEMQSRGDDFKPISAERGPVPRAACNYTKWPEVKLHDRDRRHPARPPRRRLLRRADARRAVIHTHPARPHLLPRRRHALRNHGLQRERGGCLARGRRARRRRDQPLRRRLGRKRR